MSAATARPSEHVVHVNGEPCRVFESGDGPVVGVLPGLGGMPRWCPFLDRLATERRVIVPSLPGFPGGRGHDRLDDLPDWVAATLDLLGAAGLEGEDLVGASVGGMLAAEAAAFCPPAVGRLALLAPLGLFAAEEPTLDVFARLPSQIPQILCSNPDLATDLFAPPGDVDAVEWQIDNARASEAAARLMWPLGDRGLRKRLHRIRADTLLLWGDADEIVPASYAKRFADGISGETTLQTIAGAGHLAYLDQPTAVADALLAFTGRT